MALVKGVAAAVGPPEALHAHKQVVAGARAAALLAPPAPQSPSASRRAADVVIGCQRRAREVRRRLNSNQQQDTKHVGGQTFRRSEATNAAACTAIRPRSGYLRGRQKKSHDSEMTVQPSSPSDPDLRRDS